MDSGTYFKNVKIINIENICNQNLGESIHKTIEIYCTVSEGNLTKYTTNAKEKFVSSAIRNQEDTMQPIYSEKITVRNHFRVPFLSIKKSKRKRYSKERNFKQHF